MQAVDPHPVILVVDDEAILRLVATDMLEDEGFKVIEASNADAALDVLACRRDVRLIFTDVHMPGSMDGLDLVNEVHSRWPDVLLVITSGRSLPLKEEIPDDGRFIPKPYDSRRLLREVNDLFATHS